MQNTNETDAPMFPEGSLGMEKLAGGGAFK